MKYKMLVLDMDDTLLTDDHRISEKNKSAIAQAQEAGVKVVLASGRPTPAMLSYAKELGLHQNNSYILAYNGAVILDMTTEKVLFEQSISKEDIHALYDFSQENGVHIITYLDGNIIASSESPYIDIETNITGMPLIKVDDFKKAVNRDSVKCIILDEPERLIEVMAKLKAQVNHKSITTSKPFFLEIMQLGIDKAASLDRLAQKLGILSDEIIAVGNASNDLSMIQYAGLGVWVDNVEDALRHHADVVVASNNEDGVAEVIERFILEETLV